MQFVLGTVWMAIAFTGYCALLRERAKVNPAFLPLVTVCSLSVCLFAFGLCGVLLPAVYLLAAVGTGLFVFYVVAALRRKASFAWLISPGTVFFFAAVCLLIPVLWNAHYYHYDTFSHWGTVLSEMLIFDRFPNWDTVVNFRSYPPGTATFLYAFCKLAGGEEHVALIGQGILNIAALTALFYRVKKIRSLRFAGEVLLCAALLAMMRYDDGSLHLYSLLVDPLMGYMTVGAFLIREGERERPLRAALLVTPVLAHLSLLNGNGILFAAFVYGFLVVDFFRRRSSLSVRARFGALIPAAAVGGFTCLWSLYYHTVYGESNGGGNGLFDRPDGLYSTVFSLLPGKLFDLSQGYVQVVLAVILLTGISLWILRRYGGDTRGLAVRFAAGFGAVLGYLCALICLYCFIMSPGEASYLAAFERYIVTAVIVFAALAGDGMLEGFSALERPRPLRVIAPLAVCAVLLLCVGQNLPQLVAPPPFAQTERGRVYPCLTEAARTVPRGARVMLYNGATGRRDLYYNLMLYQLKTRSNFVLDLRSPAVSPEEDVKVLEGSDWLIVAEQDDVLPALVRRAGYEAQWRPGCRLYRILHGEDGLRLIPATE